MAKHPWWRKNRRPAPRGRGPKSIGVDLNRNFPILWDFKRHFAPGTVQSSRKPGDYETYVGPRAASEPETRNVMWLFDRFPNIRFFIDLHSYGETLLYNWGGDENQSHDPEMCFMNEAYDGKRGLIRDDVYREHMLAADQELVLPGRCHPPSPRTRVPGAAIRPPDRPTTTPIAGTSSTRRRPRLSLYDGVGAQPGLDSLPSAYQKMRKVMREVTAGLLEFCLRGLRPQAAPHYPK